MKYELYNGNCLTLLLDHEPVTTIFADPFDNIGLGYDEYKDRMPDHEYVAFLDRLFELCVCRAKTSWFSFNARWTFDVGAICKQLIYSYAASPKKLQGKPCQQVFTFGQHNKKDFGNNHRPLYRLNWDDAPQFPDAIKVPSWRQRNGDKRAAAGGRVPGDVFDNQYPSQAAYNIGMWLSAALDDQKVCPEMKADIEAWFETHCGDVFDFPRVTGNSKQRCDWHPTQLHEDLVTRCLKFSTDDKGHVLDPFGGTGTTLRVCKRLGIRCTLFELDQGYCEKIAEENGLKKKRKGYWASN